jgi:hypothetical protein
MNSQTATILLDLRPDDAQRVAELFPPARRTALLEQIVATKRPLATSRGQRDRRSRARSAHRWRPAIAGALAAGALATLAAAALSGGSDVGPATAQAVAFRTAPSGAIVATVTDPFAAQSQLDAAFAARGLKITVTLIPVTPSVVGTVLFVGESGPDVAQIKALQGGHCLTGGGGCPVGVEIPRDFAGSGSITLGRPARAGERYESAASSFAPGEPLHCSGLLGARVADALPVLQRRGLKVAEWREDSESSPGVSRSVTLAQPPVQNYVWGAELVEADRLRVTTAIAPWPDTPGAGAEYNSGC